MSKHYIDGWHQGRHHGDPAEAELGNTSYMQGFQDGKANAPYWDGYWAARLGTLQEEARGKAYDDGYIAGVAQNAKKAP